MSTATNLPPSILETYNAVSDGEPDVGFPVAADIQMVLESPAQTRNKQHFVETINFLIIIISN